jgi:DNA-binding MarR family transcriptional regulator
LNNSSEKSNLLISFENSDVSKKYIIRETLTNEKTGMMAKKEHLFIVFEKLLKIKSGCSCDIFSECGLSSEITIKQIGYLKAIDEHGEVTFGRLAQITNNSKPTVTEMINKFVKMKCVYREKSSHDGRVVYIRLTEKGQMVARAEEKALMRVIDKMVDILDQEEIDMLIKILQKME